MAQPVYCDETGCGQLAVYLVKRLDTPEVSCWCDLHWLTLAQSIVEVAAEQEAAEADAAAIATLQGTTVHPDPTESAPSSDAAPVPGGAGGLPDGVVLTEEGLGVPLDRHLRNVEAMRDVTPAPESGPDDPTDDPTDEPAAPKRKPRRRAAVHV